MPRVRGADEEGIIERWKVLAEAEPDQKRRAEYAVKGWNVKTSSVANEWRAEGREEGRKLGREQGIELGRVETQRRTLKRLISKRFGILPTELLAAIDSTDDASVLDDRFDDSLEAASFDDMKLGMRI